VEEKPRGNYFAAPMVKVVAGHGRWRPHARARPPAGPGVSLFQDVSSDARRISANRQLPGNRQLPQRGPRGERFGAGQDRCDFSVDS
jgi:hypothetical protein